MMSIAAARVFDGITMHARMSVEIEAGTVTALRPGAGTHDLPPDWLLAPGFVDLQVNGATDLLFNDLLFNDAPATDALAAIAAALARLGTTSMLPTLISAHETIARALAATADAIRAGVAGVLGTHIEGPFINPARRGVHPARAIVPIREEDVALLVRPHPGIVAVTLAPECIEAGQLDQLVRGPVVFAGHSEATWEQADRALEQGVVGFTHLFNAMSQFGSRAPGCVGAALAHARACAGIICDGLHVHPASVRAAFRAMGPDRLFLVSDCMPTVGGTAGRFTWDGESIVLSNGRLARADGTLAGAHVTMAECVERAVRLCGIPLADALRMATATPARHAGATRVGRLAPGCRADLVALDEALRVQAVWQGGRRLV